MTEEQQFSSHTDNQQSGFESAEDLKQQVAQDIQQIEDLARTGQITQEQGRNLMNFVMEKAFEKYTIHNVQEPSLPVKETFLQKTMPEFFNRDGRSDVFDYLKGTNVDFDDDEISKISSLVETIEKSAIDRYLREQEHEKTLNSENETAKQRLRANAQNSTSDGDTNLVFTREQIGKMSGAEFAKHERAIMDQLRKGLIR